MQARLSCLKLCSNYTHKEQLKCITDEYFWLISQRTSEFMSKNDAERSETILLIKYCLVIIKTLSTYRNLIAASKYLNLPARNRIKLA